MCTLTSWCRREPPRMPDEPTSMLSAADAGQQSPDTARVTSTKHAS